MRVVVIIALGALLGGLVMNTLVAWRLATVDHGAEGDPAYAGGVLAWPATPQADWPDRPTTVEHTIWFGRTDTWATHLDLEAEREWRMHTSAAGYPFLALRWIELDTWDAAADPASQQLAKTGLPLPAVAPARLRLDPGARLPLTPTPGFALNTLIYSLTAGVVVGGYVALRLRVSRRVSRRASRWASGRRRASRTMTP